MPGKRYGGILLHPTSLPGPHGSGDLGPSAHHFIDWLVAAKQTLWQVLPLGGIGPGNSPYMSPSAFAGNELLIDLTQLRDAGWLTAIDIEPDPLFREDRVNYPAIQRFRMSRLRLASERFFAERHPDSHNGFDEFCAHHEDWLDDYALFRALDRNHGGIDRVWQHWPAPIAQRKPKALRDAAISLADECRFWKFCQWCFHIQWLAVKRYANDRGIKIVGDIPIFVSAHSADVWAHQKLFDLDDKGYPRVIAGVPPDYFSETGQRWGNPLYRWPEHARDGYRWWCARLRAMLSLCDIVRIDHFRGFESYWEIPAQSKTAINGSWKPGPGLNFFNAIRPILTGTDGQSADALRIIAEDLGIITAPVNALRTAAGFPGMRILQFAFDGKSDNLYQPHNFAPNTVVYTGTHDNDTTVGWWQTLPAVQQDHVRRYLGISGEMIQWDLIRAATASVAIAAIVPMQDVLGLDSEHRMNQPGQPDGFWEWRFAWRQVESWHAERLAELATLYGRTADAPIPSF
ncbi:4-alpha-glucanotransferase [uncultured Propionivibrio sp.]|uniref:4-alpha-glucanotransferase n=1 Tax=uncultured Propionivibrio sp. TaxID=426737 RepID=UPI0029C01941|nr:4-alpha-glucanotransferase [uncultured Propionivibrio sp.]